MCQVLGFPHRARNTAVSKGQVVINATKIKQDKEREIARASFHRGQCKASLRRWHLSRDLNRAKEQIIKLTLEKTLSHREGTAHAKGISLLNPGNSKEECPEQSGQEE